MVHSRLAQSLRPLKKSSWLWELGVDGQGHSQLVVSRLGKSGWIQLLSGWQEELEGCEEGCEDREEE